MLVKLGHPVLNLLCVCSVHVSDNILITDERIKQQLCRNHKEKFA